MIATYIFEDDDQTITEASERPRCITYLRNKITNLFPLKGNIFNYNIYYINDKGIKHLIKNRFDFEKINDINDDLVFIINEKKNINNNNYFQENIKYVNNYINIQNNNINIDFRNENKNSNKLEENNLYPNNISDNHQNNNYNNHENNNINFEKNNGHLSNNQKNNFYSQNYKNSHNIIENGINKNSYNYSANGSSNHNQNYNNINQKINNNYNRNYDDKRNTNINNDKNNNDYRYKLNNNENKLYNFNINNNFNQNELINEEKEEEISKKQVELEFFNKHKKIIEYLEILYDKKLKEKEIFNIIKNIISRPGLTIFEVMNIIEREVQIIATINSVKNEKRKFINCDDKSKNIYNTIIKKYKIFNNKKIPNLKSYWLYIDESDKRRRIVKDENGYYNYIPSFNTNNINCNDIFAKNENEIFYHYLFYKTLLCKNCDLSIENEEDELCPYSHNILKDFRIIYNYNDKRIQKFMALLLESNLFQFEDYHKFIPINIKHNINTLKVHKCLYEEFKGICPNKYENCPFYHNKDDPPRRSPALFKYIPFACKFCEINDNNNKCKLGDFCLYAHNKNEYKFHPYNYKNESECDNQKEIKEEQNEEIIVDEIEDEDINIKKEKIRKLIKKEKRFLCRKCNRIDNNGKLCYFIECKHFLCKKCFVKMKEEKKKGKNNNKRLSCPFCYTIVKKNKVVFLHFNFQREK